MLAVNIVRNDKAVRRPRPWPITFDTAAYQQLKIYLCDDSWRLGICLPSRFDEYAKKHFRKVNTRGTNSFKEIMTLLSFVCAAISGTLTQVGQVGRSLSGTPIHPIVSVCYIWWRLAGSNRSDPRYQASWGRWSLRLLGRALRVDTGGKARCHCASSSGGHNRAIGR